jgi:3-oxoacyl-(acyl-carrier-protein) synthase
VICQKSLDGHGKGVAAAWMLNSAIQIFQSGIILVN